MHGLGQTTAIFGLCIQHCFLHRCSRDLLKIIRYAWERGQRQTLSIGRCQWGGIQAESTASGQANRDLTQIWWFTVGQDLGQEDPPRNISSSFPPLFQSFCFPLPSFGSWYGFNSLATLKTWDNEAQDAREQEQWLMLCPFPALLPGIPFPSTSLLLQEV